MRDDRVKLVVTEDGEVRFARHEFRYRIVGREGWCAWTVCEADTYHQIREGVDGTFEYEKRRSFVNDVNAQSPVLHDAGTGAFYSGPHHVFGAMVNELRARGSDYRAMLWLRDNARRVWDLMEQDLRNGFGEQELAEAGIDPSNYWKELK